MDLFDSTLIVAIAGGLVGYGKLTAKVKSEADVNKERYESLQRSIDKIDERQEDLIDLLLRERTTNAKR